MGEIRKVSVKRDNIVTDNPHQACDSNVTHMKYWFGQNRTEVKAS